MATPERIRNIASSPIDAGKTTVTERCCLAERSTARCVDMGTTTTDDDPEEAERGITICSACAFPWKDIVVNLIDTPGHVDFTAEVERSLRVLDGGVVVFSAREGVGAERNVWRQAKDHAALAFINKMDREGAEFETVSKIAAQSVRPERFKFPWAKGLPTRRTVSRHYRSREDEAADVSRGQGRHQSCRVGNWRPGS